MKRYLILTTFFFQLAISYSHAQSELQLDKQAIAIRKSIENGPPQFSMIGELTKGRTTEFSVNGEDFVIDSDTRVSGTLRHGKSATIRGQRLGNRNYAKKIFIQENNLKTETITTNVPDEVYTSGREPTPLKLQ